MIGVIEFAEQLTTEMEPLIESGMTPRKAFNTVLMRHKGEADQLPIGDFLKRVESRLGQKFTGPMNAGHVGDRKFICKKDQQLPPRDRNDSE
jgi:hypothetical protein